MSDTRSFLSLPYVVVILAIVGLLINISTVMVYSQLPMYMKTVLGASAKQATLIDGVVESIAHVTRVASGVISDMFQNRKSMLILGYGITAMAKPLLLIAPSLALVFAAQSFERLANGIIASPRDALVGDVTEKPKRGASYGFMRSMKTIGSVLGALAAMFLMYITRDSFSTVFLFAAIPAVVGLVLIIFFVRDAHKKNQREKGKSFRLDRELFKNLGSAYWKIIFLATFFELAHFSETLLSWRIHDVGLSTSFVGIVMVVMNVGQFLMAYPLGRLSDRFNRKIFLMIGFLFMVAANIFLGFGESVWMAMMGIFFWGAQMSVTQSIFLAMISDHVSKELRGTAFGIFYFTSGLCYLVSSGIAGHLWDHVSPLSVFMNSAAISVASVLILFYMMRRQKKA